MSLERVRALHADLEKLQKRAVADLLETPKLTRDKVLQQHRLKRRLDQYNETAQTLLAVYDDADGARREELSSLQGPNKFEVFKERVRSILNSPPAYLPSVQEDDQTVENAAAAETAQFSYEEAFGMFVDMHALCDRYVNLPQLKPAAGGKRIDYSTFLGQFWKGHLIPRNRKLHGLEAQEYLRFLEDCLVYLTSLYSRIFPVISMDQLLALIDAEFEKRWNEPGRSNVPGWEGSQSVSVKTEPTDTSNPLFCNACQKDFSKQSVFDSHLSGKKHQKSAAALKTGVVSSNGNNKSDSDVYSSPAARQVALKEARIAVFAQLLQDRITATQTLMEKKQTWTEEEKESEMQLIREEVARNEEEELSDDDEPTFINYKNVPLGWDGKPIPYWLYKLHGLNIEYKCQICGDYSYWGPRNFERHFQEARHAYGMRCLGIPNTRHFIHVTNIQEAVALHEKVKKMQAKKLFHAEDEEELEDADGHVFNRKTYEDLKRQGLLREQSSQAEQMQGEEMQGGFTSEQLQHQILQHQQMMQQYNLGQMMPPPPPPPPGQPPPPPPPPGQPPPPPMQAPWQAQQLPMQF